MKRSGIRVGVPGFVWRGFTVVNPYAALVHPPLQQ
jgi:hypothetical protein